VSGQWTAFEFSKGGIKFTEQHQLPDDAFDALVEQRRDEIDAAVTTPHRR
jgi:hypothetical protein